MKPRTPPDIFRFHAMNGRKCVRSPFGCKREGDFLQPLMHTDGEWLKRNRGYQPLFASPAIITKLKRQRPKRG